MLAGKLLPWEKINVVMARDCARQGLAKAARRLHNLRPARSSRSCHGYPDAPQLPPELIEALRQRDLPGLLKALLSARATAAEAPGKAAPSTPRAPAAGRRRESEPSFPRAEAEGLSPGEVPRTGSAFAGWLMALLLGYLVYRLWGG